MSTSSPTAGKVTQKEAESYIPTIDEAVGESDFLAELRLRRSRQNPKEETNLLVMGRPGRGNRSS